MKTIAIGQFQMPITEELDQAFAEYYAYYTLPSEIKWRIDPKAKKYQWLYDDFRIALASAWEEFIQDFSDQDIEQYEELCYEYEESALDQLDKMLEQDLEIAE
jgi:hypothetical protein